MRPTELQFRNPSQQTPDYYDTDNRYNGQVVKFKQLSKNRRGTLPISRRFAQYDDWQAKTGQFLGPGTYNEYVTFRMLTDKPCNTVYRESSVGKRSADPCYIICGNLMKYEPAYQSKKERKLLNKVGVNKDQKVSVKTAFKINQLKDLKRSSSAYVKKEQNKQEILKQAVPSGTILAYSSNAYASNQMMNNGGVQQQQQQQVSNQFEQRSYSEHGKLNQQVEQQNRHSQQQDINQQRSTGNIVIVDKNHPQGHYTQPVRQKRFSSRSTNNLQNSHQKQSTTENYNQYANKKRPISANQIGGQRTLKRMNKNCQSFNSGVAPKKQQFDARTQYSSAQYIPSTKASSQKGQSGFNSMAKNGHAFNSMHQDLIYTELNSQNRFAQKHAKDDIIFTRSAQNFYNLQKGYFRPGSANNVSHNQKYSRLEQKNRQAVLREQQQEPTNQQYVQYDQPQYYSTESQQMENQKIQDGEEQIDQNDYEQDYEEEPEQQQEQQNDNIQVDEQQIYINQEN